MRTKIALLIALFLCSAGAMLFIVAPKMNPQEKKVEANQAQEKKVQPEPEKPKTDPIKEQLKSMSLDEKIAQLLIVQKTGPITEKTIQRLTEAPYGGYILMGQNYTTLSATRDFVKELQEKAKTKLIIATDQEGGLVQRIAEIKDKSATDIPEMSRVGATGDKKLAQEIGRIMAEEMRVIGINVDFAPDADVVSNPYNTVIGTRSFSSKPEVVSEMSLALAKGLEENGVIATYKHFPGHGDTATDSHLSLPVINRTRAELDKSDLVPFKNAVKNGAKIIMTGHIALPKITNSNTPATLSKEIQTKLLREELGYEGLIITDGMNMGAIVNNYPEADAYYKAIDAGADMLVLPSSPSVALASIKEHISEERIDESVYRILKFKNENLDNYEYLDESYFGSEEHNKIVQRIP